MPSRRLIKDPERYRTVLCVNWATNGSCPYGRKCQFAHGKEELRSRTAPLMTELGPGLGMGGMFGTPHAPMGMWPPPPQQQQQAGPHSWMPPLPPGPPPLHASQTTPPLPPQHQQQQHGLSHLQQLPLPPPLPMLPPSTSLPGASLPGASLPGGASLHASASLPGASLPGVGVSSGLPGTSSLPLPGASLPLGLPFASAAAPAAVPPSLLPAAPPPSAAPPLSMLAPAVSPPQPTPSAYDALGGLANAPSVAPPMTPASLPRSCATTWTTTPARPSHSLPARSSHAVAPNAADELAKFAMQCHLVDPAGVDPWAHAPSAAEVRRRSEDELPLRCNALTGKIEAAAASSTSALGGLAAATAPSAAAPPPVAVAVAPPPAPSQPALPPFVSIEPGPGGTVPPGPISLSAGFVDTSGEGRGDSPLIPVSPLEPGLTKREVSFSTQMVRRAVSFIFDPLEAFENDPALENTRPLGTKSPQTAVAA